MVGLFTVTGLIGVFVDVCENSVFCLEETKSCKGHFECEPSAVKGAEDPAPLKTVWTEGFWWSV